MVPAAVEVLDLDLELGEDPAGAVQALLRPQQADVVPHGVADDHPVLRDQRRIDGLVLGLPRPDVRQLRAVASVGPRAPPPCRPAIPRAGPRAAKSRRAGWPRGRPCRTPRPRRAGARAWSGRCRPRPRRRTSSAPRGRPERARRQVEAELEAAPRRDPGIARGSSRRRLVRDVEERVGLVPLEHPLVDRAGDDVARRELAVGMDALQELVPGRRR